MIDLKLPSNGKKAQCDCLISTVYSVIFNMGNNYNSIFALFCGFQYHSNEKTSFDERFERGGLIQTADYSIQKITGVEVCHKIYSGNAKDLKSIIHKNAENGLPVAIQLDAYNCLWNVAYQKVHFNHYVLTRGYKDEMLLCQDPFCYINSVKLDEKAQSNIGRNYYTYNINHVSELTVEDNKKILESALRHYIKNQTNENILKFSEDLIGQQNYFNKLRQQQPVIVTPFFIKLKSIVSDRFNFLIFLKSITEVMPNVVSAAISDYQNLVKYWNDTYLFLVKSMSRDVDFDVLIQIGQRFIKLASDEYRLIQIIMSNI